jgi:hypothetical protein
MATQGENAPRRRGGTSVAIYLALTTAAWASLVSHSSSSSSSGSSGFSGGYVLAFNHHTHTARTIHSNHNLHHGDKYKQNTRMKESMPASTNQGSSSKRQLKSLPSCKRNVMTRLFGSQGEDADATTVDDIETKKFAFENLSPSKFDLTTALFCAGLAFDAYAEPEVNSPRWEKGAAGLNIAFMSSSFTRSLYRGLVEITPKNATDLPDESDGVESVLSGSGVDPYFLVAMSEGKWGLEDAALVKDRFSKGVLALTGSAHICRSSTAWSNVNKNVALKNVQKNAKGLVNDKSLNGNFSTAYYEDSSWGKGGRAFWMEEPSQYIYVREPDQASLVLTLMDEDVVGDDDVIGSTSIPLSTLIPLAKPTNMKDLVAQAKKMVLQKMKEQAGAKGVTEDMNVSAEDIQNALVQQWEGTLKLKTKPRKEDKKGQMAMGVAAGALVAGPAGAAVGGFIGNMMEQNVRGVVGLRVRYLPIPETKVERKRYEVRKDQEMDDNSAEKVECLVCCARLCS